MAGRVADRGVVLSMAAKATSRPEGRPRAPRSPEETARDWTQGQMLPPAGLDRVKEAAAGSRQTQFTALLHHVDAHALERAYRRQRKAAAPGIDGVTVEAYGRDLEANLRDLKDRIHRGAYRPKPVRRVHIPKADGGKRPLGLPALEDKIVQGAVAEVLSAIYEADFLDCSYGFRPGRNAHDALAAVQKAVMAERANWVLDADIRSFFDSVDHDWLLRMLAHRTADRRILELIRRWLKAGVLEEGIYADTVEGTPQGAGISPLLANIFLHYVLDLWVAQWERRHATGPMRLVRYADDFVLTFQKQQDAERMMVDLAQRLAEFGLHLHEGKTRLVRFGRYAAEQRRNGGEGRPETFDFLGFTHYCATSREGRFVVKRRTQRKRKIRKLKALRQEMKRRMHEPLRDQQSWLLRVLRGHYAYYGIPGNSRALAAFRHEVERAWLATLRRRSQRPHLPWSRFRHWLELFPLPEPRLTHAWRTNAA